MLSLCVHKWGEETEVLGLVRMEKVNLISWKFMCTTNVSHEYLRRAAVLGVALGTSILCDVELYNDYLYGFSPEVSGRLTWW